MRYLNASFYQFLACASPDSILDQLEAALRPLDVKGTLILAPEGINGFLAGSPPAVHSALTLVRAPFPGIDVKMSPSEDIPFRKLVLKTKPEIVTFRVPEMIPPDPAPRLSPEELAEWYEQGKDFLLLDTRNEYEVRLGKFKGALSLNLGQFVELPGAIADKISQFQGLPLVTYCTGGIRCEKAAPYLRSIGLDALQLDGGILRYFEKVGDAHWDGECFVFDERVAVDSQLKATGAQLCPHCQGPVQKKGRTCIHCHKEL